MEKVRSDYATELTCLAGYSSHINLFSLSTGSTMLTSMKPILCQLDELQELWTIYMDFTGIH
jgi:hypothetical protein